MSALLELAERCEKATGPDRKLEVKIAKAVGRYGPVVLGSASVNFTASIDAAMTLAIDGISAPDVLRHAITRCGRYGCPTFIDALPRFVTAEWLRARASQ